MVKCYYKGGMYMLENEVWKTYQEFPWVEGSRFGEVRTVDHYVAHGNGKRFVKGHVLRQYRNGQGYLFVSFSVNGKTVNRFVHRIVLSCFVDNPNNLPEANHKDCDPTNNAVDNLEWCTGAYNCRYREKYGVSAVEARGHPLFAVRLKTQEVLKFPAQNEASRKLGISKGQINKVLKGGRKTVHGYWFTEDEGYVTGITNGDLRKIAAGKCRPLVAINLKTQEVRIFFSQSEAARKLRVGMGNLNGVIKRKLKHTKGYWFTNADNNAVEAVRRKFGDYMADKVSDLLKDEELV